MTPLPFEPEAGDFDRDNAIYLAHASALAYDRNPDDAVQRQLGLTAFAFHCRLTRVRGFLGLADTHAVLAFRGSNPGTLPNWIADVVVKLVTCEEYTGRVHHGFSTVLRQTWKQITTLLEVARDRPLYLTGHSMGGALAVLAGCRLAATGRMPAAVYTFGAPRVGDRAFCMQYALPTYRVVNRLDLVPELPLASAKRLLPLRPRFTNERFLGQLKKLAARVPCYGHVRTLVYIDLDGTVTVGGEMDPWPTYAVRRAIATRGRSFAEGITDHLIGNYIAGLRGESNATTLAPARRRPPLRRPRG
jgi:triacylglycerol lipase